MENSISDVLIASNFSFCHYYRTMDGHTYGTLLPFSREKVLQNDTENKLICGNAVACTKYGSGTPPDYKRLYTDIVFSHDYQELYGLYR